MKRILPLVLFCSLAVVAAAPYRPVYLVAAMTKARYNNPTIYNACGRELARIMYDISTNETPTQAQVDSVMRTWARGWRYAANTSIVIYVYCESDENLRKTKFPSSPAQRSQWIERIKKDPQIEAGWTNNPKALLKSWGLIPPPIGRPPQ